MVDGFQGATRQAKVKPAPCGAARIRISNSLPLMASRYRGNKLPFYREEWAQQFALVRLDWHFEKRANTRKYRLLYTQSSVSTRMAACRARRGLRPLSHSSKHEVKAEQPNRYESSDRYLRLMVTSET